MDLYEEVIFKSRYARYRDDLGRRENWNETVARYVDNVIKPKCDEETAFDIYDAIYNMEIMPSMRMLMTAGEALDRDHVAGYNCSYLPIDSLRAFDEAMYILLCGTGVGFSVESKYVSQLPVVSEEFHETNTTIEVGDSKIGWASALRELVSLLYAGKIPRWNTSKVRPAGARLKTFGGRASGPGPLEDLFNYTTIKIRNAAGRKLSSIEVHDLVCKIADIVVVGGVRRSALISLSDLEDDRMATAKTGQWWLENGQRSLANNSVAYKEKPDTAQFLKEWTNLYESRSGERGIFNRNAATRKYAEHGRRDGSADWGINPCAEIILRPNGFCNLCETILRPDDNFESIKRKVELATIVGTIQSTYTKFRYLRSIWRRNAEEERLLGVSFTGIMDNELTRNAAHLESWKQHAIETNKIWAAKLGIPVSAAITTVKPSGTVSQLVGCSSGIHPSYSPYYIRTIRGDKKDPLTQCLKDAGVPCEQDVARDSGVVFSFPCKAPDQSITREECGPIQQLELGLEYATRWCEHNVSQTIYIRENEWLDVGAWVYKNWDDLVGVSFLPHSDHVYKQAPYQEITKEEYEKLLENFPKSIDWSSMKEDTDNTIGSQELSCAAGVCEVT